jgi:hypothetical protein
MICRDGIHNYETTPGVFYDGLRCRDCGWQTSRITQLGAVVRTTAEVGLPTMALLGGAFVLSELFGHNSKGSPEHLP